MFKEFYRRKIEDKLEETDFLKFIEIAKKYDKILTDKDMGLGDTGNPFCTVNGLDRDGLREFFLSIEKYDYRRTPVFIRVSSRVGAYTCFYKNLMFVFNIDPDESGKFVTIYMKTPEDKWYFDVTNNGYGERTINVLSPVNTHAKVYVGYTVTVYGMYKDTHEEYTSGSWNKEFYKTLNEFIDKVEGFTEYSILEKAY